MVKTEATRAVITACEQLVPPQDVVDALQHHNDRLELIWNPDAGRWEIYQLKSRGVTRAEDVLCWQMSAPTKGSGITTSIVPWLKQYDTTNGGMKSKEELEKEWKAFCRYLFLTAQPAADQKRYDEVAYRGQNFVKDFETEKVTVSLSIPKAVGYNKKTQKRIFAVPRIRRRRTIYGT